MLENEAELVERAKTDDQAFTILYDFYFPKIYGYIYKRVGNFDLAEDLVSATFLKVFTYLGRYNNRGYSFSAWVYRIATNNLIDHYRKAGRKKIVPLEQAEHIQDEHVDSPDTAVVRLQDRELVQRALEDVPEKYQKVLHLKFFADQSNEEIAEALEISENNVRVITFRALKSFQASYKKYG